jgi:ABC-type nitrate/sulfonate/bicarbonate transport system permease component
MKNKRRHLSASIRDTLISAASISSFLLLWEMLPALGLLDPFFSSSPSRILTAGQYMFAHGFWNDIQVSLIEFFWGMLIATILGIILGILFGWYRVLNVIFQPFITLMNAAPRVALIPLMILWLGIGLQSKIAAVMLGAFFPLVISVTKSVQTMDNNLLRCARSFGASDSQILWTLILPNSVPFIISGLHIAIGRGLVGVVIGELLASQAGVGHVMAVASATFQTDRLFVGLACLSGFGFFLTKVLEYFEKIFNRWRIS